MGKTAHSGPANPPTSDFAIISWLPATRWEGLSSPLSVASHLDSNNIALQSLGAGLAALKCPTRLSLKVPSTAALRWSERP